jgi:ER membrane protein complex subunit 2
VWGLIHFNALFQFYRKRKIAMLIAQGERHEAIRQLNDYLETFINDPEAWLELSELYLQEADYARAAFCFEELLLANVSHCQME